MRVPPNAAVISAITPADRMPAKAPRPLRTPNAAQVVTEEVINYDPALAEDPPSLQEASSAMLPLVVCLALVFMWF